LKKRLNKGRGGGDKRENKKAHKEKESFTKRIDMEGKIVKTRKAVIAIAAGMLVCMAFASLALAYPSVYPTGTTIYKPDKCWNGYTIFPAAIDAGAVLIDMNGNVVKHWKNVLGEPVPVKLLPGGYVVGSTGRVPGHQGWVDLVQVDWNGNIVWRFNKTELMEVPGKGPTWMARQHHDWQREGNPVGYYVPGMNFVDKGNTFLLCHKNVKNPKIAPKILEDDYIIEVTWDGEIVWEWLCSDHFDEFGFSEAAKNAMYRYGGTSKREFFDWMHTNSMSLLGPNKWYDAGDERFHPDNIICDGRNTNIMWIIDKKTGKIVWKVGPDYTATPALRRLGQFVGQHHCHMIPRGLPGEGNILVFDNGGGAGYGNPNPGSFTGRNNALRDYSRVIEFNPITLEVVWEYEAPDKRFYSWYISSAQRLPNGNTLICEGARGRIFEVTREGEIVWEYISPFFGERGGTMKNMVYRAYRVPYWWVPQLPEPEEKPVIPPKLSEFRIKPQEQEKEEEEFKGFELPMY